MLKLSTKINHRTKDKINWQIYQSDTEENTFFVVPVARLAFQHNGDYNFSLVEYAGNDAGGYCTFETELDVPADNLSQIKTFLEKSYPMLKPEPKIMTGRFNLKAVLNYISADATISNRVETEPSPFDNNSAIFLINLDNSELTLFKDYFGGNKNAGTFNVHYEFEVAGRLPLITVVSTFNASIAYNYEKKVIKR